MPEYVRIRAHDTSGGRLQHHYLNKGRWADPAGKVEKGESPSKAAPRELLERTGYSAKKIVPVRSIVDKDGDTIHLFEASGLSVTQRPQTEIRFKRAFVAGFLSELTKTAAWPS